MRAKLLTADAAARAGTPEIAGPLADATLLFGAMGGVGAFVAVFAIAGAFGLAVLGRAREFALLRAVGATGGQIRRMVVGEALLVALLAAVPGVALGVPLAHALRDALVERAGVPAEYTVSVGAPAVLCGVGVGVLLALLAAAAASRHAARTRPTDALREVGEPRRLVTWPRILLAVPALGGAGALFALTQRIGGEVGVAFQVLVLLLLLLGVLPLAPPLTRWFERPIGACVAMIARTTGWLAHANSAAATRRVASGAAAMMLSVAMAGDVLLVTTVLRDTTREQSSERVLADRVLTGRHGAPGLPAEVAGAVRGLPGAETVSAIRRTEVVADVLGTPDVIPAGLVDPAGVERVLDLGVRAGRLADLAAPDTVTVGRTYARARDLHVGSGLTVRLGDGRRREARVVAIFDRPLGFADLVFAGPGAGEAPGPPRVGGVPPADDLDDAVLVRVAAGHERVFDAALAAYLREHPTVEVRDGGSYADDADTELAANTTGSYLVLGVLLVFTAVAMVNTLVVGTADRAREFALIRVVGASRRQVARTVVLETAIVVLIGTLVGTAITCVALAGARGALTGSASFALPLGGYVRILGGTAFLGLAASLIPTVLALRGRPLEVLTGRG
ncbi:ABC transporter permease (plasmid) [Embleya sp. NBC_00888]|uniref:ABC transporter permease n=1 Tax=Embleya sp. NBC_00888 TaxID=2975960 RepID=UPI002F9097A2|nr:ABC transporter permease [Embleya sp. NBC_00888]